MAKETPPTGDDKKAMNRREFLNIAWLASLGFMTVSIAGMTYLFSMPRFKEGEFGGTFTVGTVAELPSPEAAPANYPKVKTWIANNPEGLLAIYKVCTHLGCLYGWSDQANRFVCPCHGSMFEKDGVYIQGPAPRSLDRFVVQIVDPVTNEILAQTDAEGDPLVVPADRPDALVKVETGMKIQGKPK